MALEWLEIKSRCALSLCERLLVRLPRSHGRYGKFSRLVRAAPPLLSGRRRGCLGILTHLVWWARQDSNLGPRDYESPALTN